MKYSMLSLPLIRLKKQRNCKVYRLSAMNTLYLTTSDEDLETAAEIIQKGGLVAFPTETVYGLGGNALDSEASKKIYAAKGRPSDNPLIVHVASTEDAAKYAFVSDDALLLGKALWPAPLTMVLPKKDVPKETTGGLDTVAIRFPANETACRFIEKCGLPIAAPSANTSGRPSPTTWQHVKHDLDGKIDAVICGDPCEIGIESTVVDMTGDAPVILRPGFVTPEIIEGVLNKPCTYDPAIMNEAPIGLVPKAPGMKYKHYAPKAEMYLYKGDKSKLEAQIKKDAAKYEAKGKVVKILLYDPSDLKNAAANLFANLRSLDEEGADIILASALPEEDSFGFSIMNRMLKAAGHKLVEVK